tara:strand:- start:160 stop:741 length:582 start_codon:yes stop_codon:yes gene_type:complete
MLKGKAGRFFKVLKEYDRRFETLLHRYQIKGNKVACRGMGCHWCCFEPSLITEPEKRVILGFFKELPDELKDRVREQYESWHRAHEDLPELLLRGESLNAGHHATRSWEEQTPCMFLVDEACAIYEGRPACCRSHHSLLDSAETCKERAAGVAATKSMNTLDLTAWVWKALGHPGIPAALGDIHYMIREGELT